MHDFTPARAHSIVTVSPCSCLRRQTGLVRLTRGRELKVTGREGGTHSHYNFHNCVRVAHNVNKRIAGKMKREKTKWRSVCGMLVKYSAVKCSLAIDNA